ncbi:MAG: LbtU family siderophore porin, partial [Deltaproteobacteria bacterium]|nr:LbtU family siderophore porin [Deltaproteobacteria bacterium]
MPEWMERINISGLIEVEAAHESMDFKDPQETDTNSNDIALATVELGIDAVINKHVTGHVLLLWEEDKTEPVDLDEGFITLSGMDVAPLYVSAGKMYVPFGSFGSHFISDPITLEIGETRESAVRAGFVNDMFDISLSIFNGDIYKINDDSGIKTIVGSAVFTLPEEALPDLGLSFGLY